MILLGTLALSACAGGAIRGSSWPGLAADENTAYLADGSLVYAVNVSDGKELWHYPEKADSKKAFYAPPVITLDGLVIVGSAGSDHNLIALNPKDIDPTTNTPVEAWTFAGATDHWVAPPLIIGDQLFAPNADGDLYILDLTDGQSSKKAVKTIELGGRLWAQPVTDGTRVFVTSLDHSVYGIDLSTYDFWHKDVGGAVPGSPVIGPDGMLYVGSLTSQLEKFDPATGEHQPVFTSKNWIWSTPALDGDTLYFGDLDGSFYSYNTASGKLDWNPIQPDGPITASPLVQNDHLLVATESGSIFAIDKNGKQLWFEAVGGQLYTTPVVSGDKILIAPLGTDFYLAALDSNGRQVWTFTPAK